MRFLLQCGIGYRHDSKDDNYFICNLLLHIQATDDPVLITCGHAQPAPPSPGAHCKYHLVKMTTSEGYCSFRVH